MDVAVGVITGFVGGAFLLFGAGMARARISLHYSYEELHNASNPRHGRVRIATLIGTALYVLFGATVFYLSIHALVGGVVAPAIVVLSGTVVAAIIEYRNRRAHAHGGRRRDRRARERRWRKRASRSSAGGW